MPKTTTNSGTTIHRVQLEMTQDRLDAVDRLQDATGLRTRKELYENAIALLTWAVEQRKAGRRLAFVDERERCIEFTMPAIEAAAGR